MTLHILPSPVLDTLLSRRGPVRNPEVSRSVEATIEDVRLRGDEALIESARRFDAPGLSSVIATQEERAATVDETLRLALDLAAARISHFHQEQLRAITGGMQLPTRVEVGAANGEATYHLGDLGSFVWRTPGFGSTAVGQRLRAVGTAGVYVPGGRAAYPSSVLMNATPAGVVSVKGLVIATPSGADGLLLPAVAAAVRSVQDATFISGDVTVAKVGGAAAIAAMALGTESVPRCDVVAGPGNQWVNEAKRQLWGSCGFDGYAGPSEVCVLVDADANAAYAAADILTQIEHAPDNVAFLVSTDEDKLQQVLGEIERQTAGAPREEILRESLRNSHAILARDEVEACGAVDRIAPEHLSIATKDPEATMGRTSNAGAILLGDHTPESAGDYLVGPSHTLPTAGAARWQSPVNVLTFMRFQSVMRLDAATLSKLSPSIETIAAAEGFPAHARGASIRRET